MAQNRNETKADGNNLDLTLEHMRKPTLQIHGYQQSCYPYPNFHSDPPCKAEGPAWHIFRM